MGKPLRVLMVEDSEDDVLLTVRALKKGGYDPVYERVEDAGAMQKAVEKETWDVILCDYQMPQFNGLAAIALLKETGIDIPLIIVSGAIGEETAVECMRLGAHDYVMKGNLSRLVPAIERESKEAESRSKRRQSEDALKKSEGKYRAVFENAIEGIYQATTTGRYVSANPAFAKILGYITPEELISSITDVASQVYVNPDERSELVKQLNVSDLIEEFEFQAYRKDGTIIWLLANARVIRDENGNIEYFEGRVQDITRRKKAENELKNTLESLRKAFGATIQVMVAAVEARDPYTAGHQSRSADLSRAIATEMELSQDKIEGIRMAGSIHDIGKLSVPAEILSKPTKLTNVEFSLIKEHARIGYEILKDVESPWPLAEIVYQHHERMDGSGYPRNLKGNEILMEARIMAVADVVESMASHRPYRPALGLNAALEEIENNKGTLYDVDAVDVCLRLFREKKYNLG